MAQDDEDEGLALVLVSRDGLAPPLLAAHLPALAARAGVPLCCVGARHAPRPALRETVHKSAPAPMSVHIRSCEQVRPSGETLRRVPSSGRPSTPQAVGAALGMRR
jgi:hypothetical protein